MNSSHFWQQSTHTHTHTHAFNHMLYKSMSTKSRAYKGESIDQTSSSESVISSLLNLDSNYFCTYFKTFFHCISQFDLVGRSSYSSPSFFYNPIWLRTKSWIIVDWIISLCVFFQRLPHEEVYLSTRTNCKHHWSTTYIHIPSKHGRPFVNF